jgi:hypothetical protein
VNWFSDQTNAEVSDVIEKIVQDIHLILLNTEMNMPDIKPQRENKQQFYH